MLTQDEYLAKRKKHFDKAGLNREQRLARYRQYVSSVAGQDQVRERIRQSGAKMSRMSRPGTHHRINDAQLTQANSSAASVPDVLRAMLNPFDLTWNDGDVPRLPDSEFNLTSTVRLRDERTITSNSAGGFCFVLRACPWAAIACSNAQSLVLNTGPWQTQYASPCEFNAAAAATSRATNLVGVMPNWTNNAWSISNLNSQDHVSLPANAQLDFAGATALFANSSAWRPVCAGARLKYIGAPLTASGVMVGARWPGTYKMPTTANGLLTMENETEVISSTFDGGGPTFATVQNLPGAVISRGPVPFTALWAPTSMASQKRWRPVKCRPIVGSDGQGWFCVNQVGNTLATDEYVFPPPCTGDAERQKALVDRLYSENAEVCGTFSGETFTLLGIDSTSMLKTDLDTLTSETLLNRMHDLYTTDMDEGDTAIIIIGEGFPPSTDLFAVESVVGVEYIPDTRSVTFGGGSASATVKHLETPAVKQLDEHSKAIAVMSSVPAAVVSTDDGAGGSDFLSGLANGAKTAAGAVKSAMSLYDEVAPLIDTLAGFLA